MAKVISVEDLTKKYELGVIGTGTLTRDVERWWARIRHQPDPYTIIGQKDNFASIGESIFALDDVSFSVEQGETLGIIGRNGAGKSTLLKILSRVTAPTSGVVKVKGRIGSLLEVGTGFHPDLTGRENVFLNGAILGMKKTEVVRKFDEIVAFSGVERFIDTPVKRYSSGMYVRLAFAVAAHLDPEILIVDEVLAVGDAEFQKKCLGKMGEVAGEGRTVLFVSHNMGSIVQLCRKGMLLNAGGMVYLGDVSECVNKYIRPDVKLDTILSHGLSLADDFDVYSVLINGHESSDVMIMPDDKFLDIIVIGKTSKPTQLSLEARLLDTNGAPIAYFSPAHFDEKFTKTDNNITGKFKINGQIELPMFTKGDYYMELYLTEPSVRGLWECKNGIHLMTESRGMVTQHTVLEQKKGFGVIILQGDYQVTVF